MTFSVKIFINIIFILKYFSQFLTNPNSVNTINYFEIYNLLILRNKNQLNVKMGHSKIFFLLSKTWTFLNGKNIVYVNIVLKLKTNV